MLTRAARRRNALRYIQQTADQIQLPWLCPALVSYRPRRISTRATPVAPSQSAAKTAAHAVRSPQASRHLASAATPSETYDIDDDYLPFYTRGRLAFKPSTDRPHSLGTRTSSVPPPGLLNLDNFILRDYSIAEAPPRLESAKAAALSIPTNMRDIETMFEACLQVHRWERAEVMLRQLACLYGIGSQRTLDAYNRFLETMIMDLIWNNNQRQAERINNWVEVDMRHAGVEPDAKTYALKIKAALATLTGSKRQRTVRRYWDMAKKYNFESQVAGLRDILTDNDLGRLSEICPMRLDFELDPDEYAPDDAVEIVSGDHIATKAPPATAEVLETPQKGLGLSAVKESLSLFSDHRHSEDLGEFTGTPEEVAEQYAVARQSRLEKDAIESAISRWRAENEKMQKMGINSNLQGGKIGVLMWQWHQALAQKLLKEKELVELAEAKPSKDRDRRDRLRCEYGPYLRLLSTEHLAAVTSLCVMQLMNRMGVKYPVKLSQVVTKIGQRVEYEAEAEEMRRKADMRKQELKKLSPSSGKSWQNPSSASRSKVVRFNPRFRLTKSGWTTTTHTRVGAILCELLLESAKFKLPKKDGTTEKVASEVVPVYSRDVVFENGKKYGQLNLHPAMADLLLIQPAGDFIAKRMPMVSPPRPWKGMYDGGYLESPMSFMRLQRKEICQRDYAEAAAARGDLDQLFAGVDVLSQTPWRVNAELFSVMVEAWNGGEKVANLAPLHKMFPDVPKPGADATPKESFQWRMLMRSNENEKAGLHSLRCFQNLQLEIAKAYLGETFYLPHNIDFRGRAYPMAPYFNQMGADNARSLMLFDKGKPLGRSGLRWLKIHLSNVFGYDKASLDDREKFPMDHLDDVIDSANNPLTGRKWWLKAEDPWQCLATCMELRNVLKLADPSQYVSRLPIHQDGSCNGLQHYAALGGDLAGARQVNLEPGAKPADVYTGVADLVRAEIKKDVAEGHAIAKELDGRLTRKMVKQPVMTNVYGVTFLGAVLQVRRQLDDLLPDLNRKGISGHTAAYITKKIFKAFGTLFSGAHEIQYWLGDCATRISMAISLAQLRQFEEQAASAAAAAAASSSSASAVSDGARKSTRKSKNPHALSPSAFRSSVIWTTPLKLPVVQPYRIRKSRQIMTNMQQITIEEPTVADAIDKRKQLQAFPPNFIHSLDATHMLLSALKARELGLEFSAVHDSFWTHACDVDTMGDLLRESFIRMHKEDIMGRLAKEFELRYTGHLYLAKISEQSELGRRIRKWRNQKVGRRARSSSSSGGVAAASSAAPTKEERQFQEMLLEAQRQRLLDSDLEAERQQGRAMETPAQMFAAWDGGRGGDEFLKVTQSLGATATGTGGANAEMERVAAAAAAAVAAGVVSNKESIDHVVNKESVDDDVVVAASTMSEGGDESHDSKPQPQPQPTKKKTAKARPVWLWLPLTFKPVPKRGEFDVERLRHSKYFFS